MTRHVQLVFVGEPFNREAVIHTLRHLAMRMDWQLTLDQTAERRIIYATTERTGAFETQPEDVVILSSRAVAEHLQTSRDPIPLALNRLPFPHRIQRSDWICADVIAGAYAAMNLWYEERTRSRVRDGWITWREDWMARAGFSEPAPLADDWLGEISCAAERIGWGKPELHNRFTVVLTHDVDYLPGAHDQGLLRALRAFARQIVSRRRALDAVRLIALYLQSQKSYFAFDVTINSEAVRNAHSSFQLVAARHHRYDPAYAIAREPILSTLQKIAASDWEICLHGSYLASYTPGMLRDECIELERIAGVLVRGHRQHYLNFHPSQLFDAVEHAGLEYDSSVGYNDTSGARAGTYFPYRPFNVASGRAHDFWEIPFVLMDTTLATTYRFTSQEAFEHSKKTLARVSEGGGCVAMIWHLEQLSGLLDPEFDQVYFELLDWIRECGGIMTNGREIIPEWEMRWRATMADTR